MRPLLISASDALTVAAAAASLHDHLHAQAGECLSGQEHLVASHLIDQIDDYNKDAIRKQAKEFPLPYKKQ